MHILRPASHLQNEKKTKNSFSSRSVLGGSKFSIWNDTLVINTWVSFMEKGLCVHRVKSNRIGWQHLDFLGLCNALGITCAGFSFHSRKMKREKKRESVIFAQLQNLNNCFERDRYRVLMYSLSQYLICRSDYLWTVFVFTFVFAFIFAFVFIFVFIVYESLVSIEFECDTLDFIFNASKNIKCGLPTNRKTRKRRKSRTPINNRDEKKNEWKQWGDNTKTIPTSGHANHTQSAAIA